MKTLIVGGGNMGTSFAQSFLDAHILRQEDIAILERNEQRQNILKMKEWQNVHSDPGEYVRNAELIIIAVKPQDTSALFDSLKPYISHKHVVLSIMAGVTMDTICDKLNIGKVIRAMPNLPAQVGMGMTGFTAKDEVTRLELTNVQNLLNTTGKSIYFSDEKMLDAVTAVSGSGPAYVYFFMNAMMKRAMKLGFTEAQADLLVWQTFHGAVQLQNQNHLSYEEWIGRVSSKGGTTEAALNTFKEKEVEDFIGDGLEAAFKRAKELGE